VSKEEFEKKIKFTAGVVVRSASGRDKGDFQVIVSVEGGFAFVCDGRRRILEKPKKKNVKHLFFTNTILERENMISNKLIRKSLAKFISSCKN
jgi:ribosomal protein L14E/L6E/L27E